jgi:hypothetical protein
MRRIARTFPALLFVLCLAGCPSLTDSLSPTAGKKTYPSIWIYASWSGGRTGTPLESKAVTPSNIIGSYCPANSLVPLNHSTSSALPPGYDQGLVVQSNCTSLISEVAACNTAGTGGTANSMGTCGVDPRKTSSSNLLILPLPPLSKTTGYYGRTSLNLDVNLFYCATGSHMNLGEVSGKDPTDCVVD